MELNRIYNEDCLEGMKRIPDKSIDMILCDLPYGTTVCKWDTVIPFESLWEQYERVVKDNGAIVLFGSEPFASHLRLSAEKLYRYDWYWNKSKAVGFFNVKKMPLKSVETISVFYKQQPIYNPQGLKKFGKVVKNADGHKNKKHITGQNGGTLKEDFYFREYTNHPRQILDFSIESKPKHPTQKPVALFEYLIRTYTNEGETVLDNCMGSGTTAIACMNTNRNYIGFELDETYYKIANERIASHQKGGVEHDTGRTEARDSGTLSAFLVE